MIDLYLFGHDLGMDLGQVEGGSNIFEPSDLEGTVTI